MHNILNMSIYAFKKHRIARYFEYARSIQTMKNYYGGQAFIALIDIPFGLLFLGLIYFWGGWLVCVPIVLGCLLLLRIKYYSAYFSRIIYKQKKIQINEQIF